MSRLVFNILLSFLLLVACAKTSKDKRSTPRSVKVATVQDVDYVERDFAGMATADDATMLAFKISGQVASVDVGKGDMVSRGQLLARLDPRDVELQVASDRSKYEQALSQYERMRRLLEHDAVSQQEVEVAEATFVQAQSKYENSKDLLVETQLRAPFAGVVERTYVDAFQRVDAGQTILRLVNPISTTVEFTMSERSMFLLADTATRYYVRFDNYPSRRFVARLDSYAKTASDASGFPVSLKLSKDEIQDYRITPGLTCQVTIRASESASDLVAIPLTAVYAPAQGGNYVWLVTSDDRVERCAVTLGDVFGRNMVTVLSGLEKGDVVVIAGVYRLKEGEKVRIIK